MSPFRFLNEMFICLTKTKIFEVEATLPKSGLAKTKEYGVNLASSLNVR